MTRAAPRILIVEDDELVASVLVRRFAKLFNATCDVVATAESALHMLARERRHDGEPNTYDVVTSDFNLAGALTGRAVFEWLRDHGQTNKLVFLTSEESVLEYHAASAIKPSLNELFAFVRAALDRDFTLSDLPPSGV